MAGASLIPAAKAPQTPPGAEEPASGSQAVELWLHNRPPETIRTYRADAERFRDWTGKPLNGRLRNYLRSLIFSACFIRDRSGWFSPALSNAAKSSNVIAPKVFPFSGLSQFWR
jgi:hypothetical protein